MGAKTRRALFYEYDDQFQPFLDLDVNEYLIEHWPQLTLKQRQSVWTLAQDQDAIDWDPIKEQIDEFIYTLAETDKTIELPQDDALNEAEEDCTSITIDLFQYLDEEWPDLTEEQKELIVPYIFNEWNNENMDTDIYDAIDNVVYEYGTTVDTSIDVSSMEDDEDEDESAE